MMGITDTRLDESYAMLPKVLNVDAGRREAPSAYSSQWLLSPVSAPECLPLISAASAAK